MADESIANALDRVANISGWRGGCGESRSKERGLGDKNISKSDTFYIMDGWVSDAAIDAHTAHPTVPRVVEQLLPLLAEPLDLAISAKVNA